MAHLKSNYCKPRPTCLHYDACHCLIKSPHGTTGPCRRRPGCAVKNPAVGEILDPRALLRDELMSLMARLGYTALYCHEADDCGCHIDDLMPCDMELDCILNECRLAYWEDGSACLDMEGERDGRH